MQNTGAKLTLGVSVPLLGLGANALSAAADMETLKTSLDTVFQGNQAASNSAFQQIKEFAATTPFQLEEVAGAFIKLKNLGLDPSIASLTSYGNTASALGKSLDQMIEAVADASVGEFERLKEFGIKAKSQGDNVSLTFQGVTTTIGKNAGEITEYLQNIGNTNFAGSIERQANTFAGKLSTFKDNLQQAFAGIGEVLIEYINPLFEKMNGLLKQFQDLSPTTKKWIVILGGIAAAIGPLLALSGAILPAIGTGLALLTGPIGLLVAGLVAVGVVIYKNWAPIKKTLIDIANYFIELYNESTLFRIAVEAVVARFKIMWEIGKFVFEALKSVLKSFVDSFVDRFKLIGKIFKAVFTDKGSISDIPDIIKEASKKGRENFGELTNNLGNDWKNLVTGIEKVTNKGLENITSRKKLAYIKENVDASAITEAVSDATVKGLAQGAAGGRAKVSGIDTSGLAQGVSLSGGAGIAADLPEQLELAGESINNFQDRLLLFKEESAAILADTAQTFFEGFGSLIAGIAQGANPLTGLVKLILGTVGDMLVQLGKATIAASKAMLALKAAFTFPGGGIVAGIATIAIGKLLKTFIPSGFAGSFASGGIVGGSSFYGDKLLARVNSGEAIFNQEQQKRLYNLTEQSASAVDVQVGGSVVIDGATLRVVLDRADKLQNRLG